MHHCAHGLPMQAGADVAEAVHVISELKRRLREQAHQMAAYKVDAQDKKGKVYPYPPVLMQIYPWHVS